MTKNWFPFSFQYLIVKDPNKPVLRLYDIPDNTFESDEDSDEEDEAEGTYIALWSKNIVIRHK